MENRELIYKEFFMTHISIKNLASEFNLDRSTMRKFVLGKGIKPSKLRTPDSRGQKTLVLTLEQADYIRRERGYFSSRNDPAKLAKDSDFGFLYVAQLSPSSPVGFRVKCGFANNPKKRLADFRCSNPEAELLRYWPCQAQWEKTALDSISTACRRVGNSEIFECTDPSLLFRRVEEFFATLPNLKK